MEFIQERIMYDICICIHKSSSKFVAKLYISNISQACLLT